MTDAAIPVTERAVEQFAEAYLSTLDAEIQKDGRRWRVSLPDGAETELDLDGATLVVASDPGEVADDAYALSPESEFVQLMFEEASERQPTGSVELTKESIGVQSPRWLAESPVDIVDKSFTPYYDRTALCVLFHVGIETVSEFQREELRAVAVDLNDLEPRPRLAETYLDLTSDDLCYDAKGDVQADWDTIQSGLAAARDRVDRTVDKTVQDVREKATRAAEVELSEYEQYVRQRLDELDEELTTLDDQIEEVSETIGRASDQQERVKALRKRKELRAEQDERETDRDEIAKEIDSGFREKRQEIRDRHSLTVRLCPVTTTLISYERGDLRLSIEAKNGSQILTYGYAVGGGVIDNVRCGRCGRELDEENPLNEVSNDIVGACCRQ